MQTTIISHGLVLPEEHGMKLLRFLERRLAECPPKSVLHRWIRTGQIRINTGRAKPFTVLCAGDTVRLPPFAVFAPIHVQSTVSLPKNSSGEGIVEPARTTPQTSCISFIKHDPADPDLQPVLRALNLPVVAVTSDFFIFNKPAGLAVQPGTGQADSVVHRLQAVFAKTAFVPAPVHRLDRHTSGLLLVGRTHQALQQFHRLFAQHGSITKNYYAWVMGSWPHSDTRVLLDFLEKSSSPNGRERIHCYKKGNTVLLPESFIEQDPATWGWRDEKSGYGNACALATPVRQTRYTSGTATLLSIQLITGHTHQIRVQVASRGFPIIGDTKYTGPPFPTLLLHATRLGITYPESGAADQQAPKLVQHLYTALPAWKDPFTIQEGEYIPDLLDSVV